MSDSSNSANSDNAKQDSIPDKILVVVTKSAYDEFCKFITSTSEAKEPISENSNK